MRVFDNLIGQNAAIQELYRTICAIRDDNNLPGSTFTHAWLFTGPPGSGRSVIAQCFAAAVQCIGPEPGCGECIQCKQVLSGMHSDINCIVPEGLFISVDEVRGIILKAAQRPVTGRWNIIIIEDADRLTEGASNALLKTIEEPAARTMIILCAPSAEPEDIAITIKSRCRHIRLGTPAMTEVAGALVKQGIDPERAVWASQISAGHIGRAKRLATDEKSRALRELVLSLPRAAIMRSTAYQVIDEFLSTAEDTAKAISDRNDDHEVEKLKLALGAGGGKASTAALRGSSVAIKALEKKQKLRSTRVNRDIIDIGLIDLAGLFRDAMLYSMGCTVSAIHPDYAEMVSKMASYIGPSSWLKCLMAVLEVREAIDHNVKPKFALSAMMAIFQQELLMESD